MIRHLVLMLFIAGLAFGKEGDHGGNGGDLVVCSLPGGQTSYELLDYFEAAHLSPAVPLDLGDPSWDAMTKVHHAISRLRSIDPVRAARYETEAKHFLSLVDWLIKGPGLEHIPDLGPVSIPSHCKVRQIAIRQKQFNPNYKPYLIDERLWLKLDEDHKAGLILHEIVYGEMWDLGQKTSKKARKYNGLLSSKTLDSMTPSGYEALTNDLFRPGIAFRADKFDINLLAGHIFSIDFRPLLLYPVKEKLEWRMVESLPKWMAVTPSGEVLLGVPPAGAPDPTLLTLVVGDGDTNAIAQLRIHVK